MGKGRYAGKSQEGELNRKEKRKQLKKQKKQRRVAFHSKKDDYRGEVEVNVKGKKNNLQSLNNKKKVIDKVKGENSKANIAISQINKSHKPIHSQSTKNTKSAVSSSKHQVSNNKNKTKQQLQNQAEIQREQKQIEYYEKLLGVNKKKGKYQGIAKGLGYEDDLFDFLDNISKKVKNDGEVNGSKGMEDQGENMDDQDEQMQEEYGSSQDDDNDYDQQPEQLQGDSQQYHQDNDQYQNMPQIQQQQNESYSQQQQQVDADDDIAYEQQQQQQELLDDDEDQQMNDMWNMLGNQVNEENQLSGKVGQRNSKTNNKNIPNNQTALKNNKQIQQKKKQNITSEQQQRRPSLFGNMSQEQKQQLEIRKQMNAIFNKLSDGNLMISFRQFSEIFLSAPKSSTIPVFIDLFRRFNVEVEKPHLHILLSNIALASALHHLMGNRLMAPLSYQLIKSFTQLENTLQNQEEVQQIGYSKIFQKKKNLILIFSYLYHFGSLTGEFIHSFVKYLSQSLNEHNVEFLYIIIQKIGSKIRQNDPGVLKNIIDTLRDSIQKFRAANQHHAQLSKINIIQTELNEIKFNRKVQLFSDQRMAFFTTFLSKNIPKQLNTEKQVFLPNFDQIKNANISTTTWWENLQHSNKSHMNEQFLQNEQDIEMINEITTERKKLIDLAKSLNLVTQIRKNIFVEVMEASDYLEAAQRVLALKIKNLQEIAVVLIQTCILQPTFNPYYPLVAAKIANINPKFKSKVQFTIWDQIKLLESYDARKTSNLAKFTARFVGNSLTDGSLSILKYFPDLINVHPSEAMFLIIFFTEILHVAKKQTLAQMSSKLKQPSNTSVKDSILEYLKEVGSRQKGFNKIDKMKFLRRMIMLNERQEEPHERF